MMFLGDLILFLRLSSDFFPDIVLKFFDPLGIPHLLGVEGVDRETLYNFFSVLGVKLTTFSTFL
jgi:hypothetical protein